MKEFLDEVGGKYIVQKVKQMINDVETDSVTKQELQAKLDALDINIDLSAYATKEELTNALSNIDLSAYATKEYVTDAINNAQLSGDSSSIDLSIYAKKSDLDSKANTEHTHTMSDITDYTAPDLSSYAKKTDIPDVSGYLTSIPEEYVTETELNAKGYLTEHQDLSTYALKTEIPSTDGLATTEYVDNAIANVPSGGNVDLTNYYTKEQTDRLLANLPSGGTGTKGDKGDAGVGVSSIKLVNYELIITLTDGTVHNLGNVRGAQGTQGTQGVPGIKGDKGDNGVSPTVSVTKITNGHKVAIKDVNGTKSFEVLNGKDGTSGGSSSGGSSGGCALYDTVVANGGAFKVIETEKPVGTNLSEIISDVANGKGIVGELDSSGTERLHVMRNTSKTQEELNAEFVLPNDENGRLDFLLASSFQPEEIITKTSEDRTNLKNRLKSGERMYYIIASKLRDKYKFFYGKVYYNRRATQGYLADTCYNELSEIPDNAKLDLLEGMKNMKYIGTGTYYNGGFSAGSDNDSYSPDNWLRFKEYLPTGKKYTYTSTVGNNTSSHTISEKISSPEFSAHLLDTYLSNCNKTLKISEKVNYTLAEWGDRLDKSRGEDGKSPTVSITKTTNGHTVSITDVNGTKSFDVTNGTNGTDGTNGTNGVSPTVTVTKKGKVATITCTDVNGTTTATISDGKDGASGGSSSGGGSAITYAYDTEIATGETWIDGKPIYMKVFHIDALTKQPSGLYNKRTCCQQDKFADEIISVTPRWKRSNTETYTGNVFPLVGGAMSASSASDAVSNINTALLQRLLWCCSYNNTDFYLVIFRGKVMYDCICDVFVKYTKLS